MPLIRGENFRRPGTASKREFARRNPTNNNEWPEEGFSQQENDAPVVALVQQEEQTENEAEREKAQVKRPFRSRSRKRRKKPRVVTDDSKADENMVSVEKEHPTQDLSEVSTLERSKEAQDTPRPGAKQMLPFISPPGSDVSRGERAEGVFDLADTFASHPTDSPNRDDTSGPKELAPIVRTNKQDRPSESRGVTSTRKPRDDSARSVSRISLYDAIKNASVATKEDFLSRSTYDPVPIVDLSASEETKTRRGQLGNESLSWWQTSVKNQLYMSHAISRATKDTLWSTEGGQHVRWEAHILDWICACCGDQRELQHFPTPLQLTSTNDACVLRLGFPCESSYEILGTIEDVMHWHCCYNPGPIPESIVAWIVLQMVQCVGTLHKCRVSHNQLGLDSFLVVHRKQEDRQEAEWFLVCTGLGSGACVLTEESNDGWPFKNDLFSVAHIAHMLLAGGAPLSWKRNDDGSIGLPWKYVFSNVYLRGQMAWEDFFAALLNPKTPSCGMHLAEEQDAAASGSEATDRSMWLAKMADVCTMIKPLSEMGQSEVGGHETRYFQLLWEHVRHESVASPLRGNLRFPVKLVGSPLEGEGGSEIGAPAVSAVVLGTPQQASQQDSEVSRLKALLSGMEKELQDAREERREQLAAAERRYQKRLTQQQKDAQVKLVGLETSQKDLTQQVNQLQGFLSVRYHGGQNEVAMLHAWCADSNARLNAALTEKNQMEMSYQFMFQQKERRQSEVVNKLQMRNRNLESVIATKDKDLARFRADISQESNLRQKLQRELKEKERSEQSNRDACDRLRKETDASIRAACDREQQTCAALVEKEKALQLLVEKNEALKEDLEELQSDLQRAEAVQKSTQGLVALLRDRLESEVKAKEAAEEKCNELAIRAQSDNNESHRALEEKHAASTKEQRIRITQLEDELSARAEECCQKDEKIQHLTRMVSSQEEKIRGNEEAKLHLEGEVDRLARKVASFEADQRSYEKDLKKKLSDEMKAHLEEAKRQLRDQRLSDERRLSQEKERLQEMKNDLSKREKAFEVEVRSRRARWAKDERNARSKPRPVTARTPKQERQSPSKTQYSAAITKKQSPAPSPPTALFAKRQSPATSPLSINSGSTKNLRQIEQKARQDIIPGQSLSMVGFAPISSGGVTINNPWSDSDSDPDEVSL